MIQNRSTKKAIIHNIVIGETISHTEPNFDYVTPGKIREDGKDLWGTRMKMALDMVTTDYVFVMLIDFYLWEPITYQHIEDELIFLNIQQGTIFNILLVIIISLKTIATIKHR